MIYIDSNIFVIASNPGDERREEALQVLENLEEGRMKAVTSVITVDEVVYAVKGLEGAGKAEEVWKKILSETGLNLTSLEENDVSSARKHFPDFDPRDALHLQSFKNSRADRLLTEDKEFLEKIDQAISLEKLQEK